MDLASVTESDSEDRWTGGAWTVAQLSARPAQGTRPDAQGPFRQGRRNSTRPSVEPLLLPEDRRGTVEADRRLCPGSCWWSEPWPITTADAPCAPTRSNWALLHTSPCSDPATLIQSRTPEVRNSR